MLTGNGVRKECRSKESESNGGLYLGNPVGMVMMMAVVMVMMAVVMMAEVVAAARDNLPAASLDGLGHSGRCGQQQNPLLFGRMEAGQLVACV